jgi:hypothetical protein
MKKQLLPILILLFVYLNSFGKHPIRVLRNKETCGQFIQQYQSNKSEMILATESEISVADSDKYIINGKVYDSTLKQSLPFASIAIINRNIDCTSDEHGNFTLRLPRKFSKKNFKLVAFYVGYEPTKVKIENKKKLLCKDLIFYLHPRKDTDEVIQICCN